MEEEAARVAGSTFVFFAFCLDGSSAGRLAVALACVAFSRATDDRCCFVKRCASHCWTATGSATKLDGRKDQTYRAPRRCYT